MRAGAAVGVADLEPGDHVSCGVGTNAERVDLLGRYVAAGLALDERVVCVTGSPDLLGELTAAGMPGAEAARHGRLVVRRLDPALVGSAGIDAAAMLAEFRAALRGALRDGCTGLRTVADSTALPVTVRARPELLRLELELDALIRTSPMTSLCMYAVPRVGDGARAIGAVHRNRLGRPPACSFAVEPLAPGEFAVSGEIDLVEADAWQAVLDAVTAGRARTTLDVGALTFIDVRGLRMLARRGSVTLRNPPAIVRRCLAVLDLAGVRVED